MKVMLRTVCISPHLDPFCKELAKRVDDFKFVYQTQDQGAMRRRIGWENETDYPAFEDTSAFREEAKNVDVLIEMNRDFELIEARVKKGLMTFYCSERWFKPPIGFFRIAHPRYFKMAWRFCRCLKSDCVKLLPIGIHAARDFARLMGLFNGDLRCLFRAPKLNFESKPGGQIWIDGKLTNKMRMWGYFVDSTTESVMQRTSACQPSKKVMWVGRMLDWKRVDTLVKACRKLKNIELTICGEGPEENKIKKLAAGASNITIQGYVPNTEVRRMMQTYDVYVMPSNSSEGWGAAISEALTEGIRVIGTFDAGSSGTILPATNLFKAGDVKGLVKLLSQEVPVVSLGLWTGDFAARTFLELVKGG